MVIVIHECLIGTHKRQYKLSPAEKVFLQTESSVTNITRNDNPTKNDVEA